MVESMLVVIKGNMGDILRIDIFFFFYLGLDVWDNWIILILLEGNVFDGDRNLKNNYVVVIVGKY
jgi:hypothetical protein